MKVKRIFLFTILSLLLLPVSKSFASNPSFSFYPDGGVVADKNEGFIVDVLIDSDGEELTSARFTVTFDPSILQLKKTERNNSLFDQYPDDESTIDNDNGVVMLTGFTQSGSGDLYVTGDSPDIMARLTFEVVKEGTVTLDWEFSGDNDNFQTVMLKEGSPPQNILDIKPSSAEFEIGDVIYVPSSVNTGLSIDQYVLCTGVVLILFGGLLVFSRPERIGKHKGTVVMYEE